MIKKIKKAFCLEQILNQYKQANNQKRTQIKEHIQYTFHKILEHRMVQDNCQIKFKSKKRKTQYIQLQNITPLLIGQSKITYFYEKVL